MADELPGLDAFGEALVAATRREDAAAGTTPPLPGLDAFGGALVAATRRRDRRRWRARRAVLGLLVALPIATTTGAATAVVLREAVIRPPADAPAEQTPLAGTARVSDVRAADPDGGLPWTVRVARGRTGFTCTTVGQVRDGVFGLTGLDGVFRRLPGELSDACGQGGTLTGARVLAADRVADVRTVVYGAAGDALRAATLTTATGESRLPLGADGTFVAALRGYPEDSAVSVTLRFHGDRTERHAFGATADGDTALDPEGGQAWQIETYVMGTRWRCARIRTARSGAPERPASPTACLGLRVSKRDWVADAATFRPGQNGPEGFDRWQWLDHPARTIVWGAARTGRTLDAVTLLGAGAPRPLTLTPKGTFAIVLPATVDPASLTLEVRRADGSTERERPGQGLTPDPVEERRRP